MAPAQQRHHCSCSMPIIKTWKTTRNTRKPTRNTSDMPIWSFRIRDVAHLLSTPQFPPRAAFVTSNSSEGELFAMKESFNPLITNISGENSAARPPKKGFFDKYYAHDYDELEEESEWDDSEDEYSDEEYSNDANGYYEDGNSDEAESSGAEDEDGGDEDGNGDDEEENGDDKEDNGDDKDDEEDENEAEQEDDDEECDEDVKTVEQSDDEEQPQEQAASDNGHKKEIDNQVSQEQQPIEDVLTEDMEEPMQEPMLNEQPVNVEQPLPKAQQAVVNQEGLRNEQQELTDSSTDDENDMNSFITFNLGSRLNESESQDEEDNSPKKFRSESDQK